MTCNGKLQASSFELQASVGLRHWDYVIALPLHRNAVQGIAQKYTTLPLSAYEV